ncbi:MAG: RDD family protein [Burkholderiaceae bacterium]|nr:RDD family protein [Burkholderiaceae bacterium]
MYISNAQAGPNTACYRAIQELAFILLGKAVTSAPIADSESEKPTLRRIESTEGVAVIYAGFWPRFAACLIDILVMSPLLALIVWGSEHYRLFGLYYALPGTLFGLFYGVFLVRRFGGTPGKRLMKLRIVKVNGDAVTYREALLRYLPEWLMGIGGTVAGAMAVLSLTDAQYFATTSMFERSKLVEAAMPDWNAPLTIAINIWIWGEFLIMLTNKKRQAIHDFIAGTVIIKEAQPSVTSATVAPLVRA